MILVILAFDRDDRAVDRLGRMYGNRTARSTSQVGANGIPRCIRMCRKDINGVIPKVLSVLSTDLVLCKMAVDR